MYSHYLTPAVPVLAFAAVDGAAQLSRKLAARSANPSRAPHVVWAGLAFGALLSLAFPPGARLFALAEFRRDALTGERGRILARIPARASVQAPDALLPHLALRRRVHRAPPPERGTDYVVLDLSHRVRFAHRENLLRTVEEPGVRAWLARDDHHVVHAEPTLLLLARGSIPRAERVEPYLARGSPAPASIPLAACLAVTRAHFVGGAMEVEFLARTACPSDLALRLGADPRPRRVGLLFDGVLSPAHLRAGDRLRSRHLISAPERAAITTRDLYLGLLRASGAPPDPSDPVAVRVPLDPE
jgi:hypothetical protein